MSIASGPRLPISGCPDNPAPAQLTTEAAPPGPVAEQAARYQCAGTGALKKSARRLFFRRPGEHRPPSRSRKVVAHRRWRRRRRVASPRGCPMITERLPWAVAVRHVPPPGAGDQPQPVTGGSMGRSLDPPDPPQSAYVVRRDHLGPFGGHVHHSPHNEPPHPHVQVAAS